MANLETSSDVVEVVQSLSRNYKLIRARIEEMNDDELLELYDRAKDISNLSWFIRCLVLGTAKQRSRRGDGLLAALAKEFGIGRRAAELDIQVYDTFIKDNPDFEPALPAIFYQMACRTDAPNDAIALALDEKSRVGAYTASQFARRIRGEEPREPAPKGFYLLVPMDVSREITEHEAGLDEGGSTELFGRCKLYSIGGNTYAEVT